MCFERIHGMTIEAEPDWPPAEWANQARAEGLARRWDGRPERAQDGRWGVRVTVSDGRTWWIDAEGETEVEPR